MSIINVSVKRPIGTIMFYFGIIILGLISLYKLSINLLPELSYPKITVLTEYAGSGPEEIERFITNVLEGPLSSVPGVKKIDSVSKEGLSAISLEFHWGTDMDFALLHTKEKSEESRRELPDDCPAPVIMEFDPSAAPIMTAIINSDTLDMKSQKDTAEFIIKPRLEQLVGVSRVEIRGGDEQEISVEIDPEKVKNIGITLTEVAQAITADNVIRSSGTIKKDKLRFTLKIEGEIKSPADIENIVIRNLEGRTILIKDIGKAFFKNKLKQGNIRFNSKPAIAFMVYRDSGGNSVQATRDVKATLDSLSKEFNKNIRFHIVSAEADLIISAIDSLTSSLILGAILAVLILLLFLQNYRDPSLVAISIPISVISTFVLMYLFKVNINIMSLGGLVLGCGMFVDNSIVVLEAIHRHRDKNDLITSVAKGAKEVAVAISGSTLTTVAIFLPVIYLYGITGKLFRDQALTVTFSLMSSLFVALTVLPALSSFRAVFTKRKKILTDDTLQSGEVKKMYQIPLKGLNYILMVPVRIIGYIFYFLLAGFTLCTKFLMDAVGTLLTPLLQICYKYFNIVFEKFDRQRERLLLKVLDNKSIAVYISVLLILLLIAGAMGLKKELLPTPDTRKFEIKANTLPAYGFERTDEIASDIEKKIAGLDGVNFIFTESGAVSTLAASTEDISVNSIHFIVDCKSSDIRKKIMAQSAQFFNDPDIMDHSSFLEKNTLSQYLSSGADNFQVKVFYEDLESGKKAAKMVLDAVKDLKGLNDIKTTTGEGKPIYAVEFNQDVLNKYNIRKDVLAEYINQAVRGQQAGTLKQIQKNYDIFVRIPTEGIIATQQLFSLPITLGEQTFFLKDLVHLKEKPSINKITRESQERYFLVSANARNVRLDDLIRKAENRLVKLSFPTNTRYSVAGEEEERRKAFESLNQAIWLAILLVYMVMAAEFENVLQPLIIMFTVPMGMVGAFLFLYLTGNTLNLISGIGLMVLVGIAVNNAIVKVEYANQLRQEGLSIRDAIVTASRVRLRPILMTSLTTIFGVIPMTMSFELGSELQRPLALVILGGLFFSTFLTLILIPAFYEVTENYRDKRKQKREEKMKEEDRA